MINSTKYCHPLVKLDKPFCEQYGIKLDRYVNLSTDAQQYWNDRLWMSQKQYYQFIRVGENISITSECSHHAVFWAVITCFQVVTALQVNIDQ